MPGKEKQSETHEMAGLAVDALEARKPKRYCVMIDGVASEYETLDSFTIKFSLLSKIPISKVKYLVKNRPALVWSGQQKARAVQLLALIGEAGGSGRIVDDEELSSEEAVAGRAGLKRPERTICRKCGFPLKKGELFCDFCMTPVNETEATHVHVKIEKKESAIPPYRLFLYMMILLFALILSLIVRP